MDSTESNNNVTMSDNNSTGSNDVFAQVDMTDFYVIYGCVLGLIAIIGLIGNTLSMIVWSRKASQGSTAFLLQALACIDSFFLIMILSYHSIPMQMEYFQVSVTKTEMYLKVLARIFHIVLIAKTMTVWMVVFVTVDRYIGVCFPLRANKWCRVRYCKFGVAGLVGCSIVYNIPFWFMPFTGMPKQCSDMKNMSPSEIQTDNNAWIMAIIKQSCFELVEFVIPLMIITFCNVKLCRAIKQGDQIRANLVQKVTICCRTSVTITRTLIMIVVLFVIFETPGFILGSVYLTTVMAGPCSNVTIMIDKHFNNFGQDILKPLSDISLATNSAINVFVYCFMVRKFRRILMNIIRFRREDSPSMPTQGTSSDV